LLLESMAELDEDFANFEDPSVDDIRKALRRFNYA
jgi:hypothetical protein